MPSCCEQSISQSVFGLRWCKCTWVINEMGESIEGGLTFSDCARHETTTFSMTKVGEDPGGHWILLRKIFTLF